MCPQWKQYGLEVSYQLTSSSGSFLQAPREWRSRHELGLVTASVQTVLGFLGLGGSPLWVPRSQAGWAGWPPP